jgi:D-xylose transport system ATP-binding protein
VAIARSLLGEPKVVLLDEPTAALGVAQTAQVLDLIERLRERGLGVVLISHNLADVKAVADRVVVLRLGRNAGEYRMDETTQEEIVAAITGASDNVVTRRAARLEDTGVGRAGGAGGTAGSVAEEEQR